MATTTTGALGAGVGREATLVCAQRLGRLMPTQSGRPLRIGIVVPYDLSVRGGGVKHHAYRLAAALRANGDTVTVLGPASEPIEHDGTHGFPGVMSFVSNGGDNRMAILVPPWQVRRTIRAGRFEVLHIHEPLVPALTYWATWLSPGIPKVVTFHAHSEAPPLQLRVGQRIWGRTVYPFYARAIAVSAAAARYASIAWTRPFTIVGNGVDGDVFSPPVEPRAPGPVRLLFVGKRSDPRKGWPYLLEAYRALRAREVQVTLDVVGEGPALPVLDGLRDHGPLPLEALVQRYRAADVVIAPSTGQESFGIVLLEAMACAKPIVCCDIGGYREVVHPAGARAVPPRDAAAIVKAVEALASDPAAREAMGSINRRHALGWDWRAIAPKVRAVYSSAIGESAASPSLDALEGASDGASLGDA